jgi:hypothetical protein
MDRQTPSGGSADVSPVSPEPASEKPSSSGAGPTNLDADSSVAKTVHHLLRQFAVLLEFANHYLSARLDSVKVSLLRLVLIAIAWVLAVAILAGLVLTGTVLLCIGLAEGLSHLFHSYWLGYLSAGLLILCGFFGTCFLTQSLLLRKWRLRTIAKYESRRARQRASFGRDAG